LPEVISAPVAVGGGVEGEEFSWRVTRSPGA
jgi:hypothetical protein